MYYKILVGVPTGYKSLCPELRTWCELWALNLHVDGTVSQIADVGPQQHRILQNRNIIVKVAKEQNASHILMIDPDIVPDRYADRTGVKWWPTAWEFMRKHPGCVVGTPYVGPPPGRRPHVFASARNGTINRLDRQYCGNLKGWHKLAAIGSGMLLIDCSIFGKLDEQHAPNGDGLPYFDDVYTDWTKTDVMITQDVFFCLRCHKAGIPVYANFDCWAGHYQNHIVDPEVSDTTQPFG